ncbi:MAG: CotH kinase family protein [Bacteriovoracaceae bacterium]
MSKIIFLSIVNLVFVVNSAFSEPILNVPNQIFIQLSDSDKDFQALAQKKKHQFLNAKVKVNDSEWINATELATRGQNCLRAYRKCLSIELEKEIVFNGQVSKGFVGKKFNLASLWQDQGYISSHLGYYLGKDVGIFPLQHQYVTVFINNELYGLYLLIEKPQTYIKNNFNSPYIAKLWYLSMVKDEKYHAEFTSLAMKTFRKEFKKLTRLEINSGAHKELKGEKLYNYLMSKMNFDKYLTMLAFQTLVRNGDYSDESIYYANKTNNKDEIYFDFMAWDFDDLFKKPHFGLNNSIFFRGTLKKQLLYSLENPIDFTIARDDFLYAKFKNKLFDLLTKTITDDQIVKYVDIVAQEIAPYLQQEQILNASIHDKLPTSFGVSKYTAKYIEELLEKRKSDLIQRRAFLLSEI